jgi:hypothetical protein
VLFRSYTTAHPRTGAEVSYVLHFLGDRILAADLDVLRQEGVSGLSYTLDGAATPMPDLDEAIEVVIAGDSAGGVGVVHHLDAIAALLHEHHVGGGGAPEVVGLIDAAIGPDLSRLDWSGSPLAPLGGDTYAGAMRLMAASPQNAGAFSDASCLSLHATNPEVCQDFSHVVRHHITTPFFVRMGLLDVVISAAYSQLGVTDPMLGALVTPAGLPRVFAIVTQRELMALPTFMGEEAAAITVARACSRPRAPSTTPSTTTQTSTA